IRENVTLVKRDHNEEQILVSYYVPEMQRWREWYAEQEERMGKNDGVTAQSGPNGSLGVPQGIRRRVSAKEEMGVADRMKIFELLTLDVRERLKQKLPVYAVPTLFIPMLRLPLTPNAKVDRRALPFPGAAELLGAMPKAGDVDSRTDTEKDLAEIWSQHLPATADSLPRESSFYDLGGNSIMSVQIVPKINRKWQGVNVPMSVMAAGQPTLKSVGRYIDRSLNP
ncbi:hypothetical protein KC352_g45727, partial [Hortaea werneckii]